MITIAVDGPSGSGKSTVTDIVAKKLNILHLNTGALYRAIGLYALDNNLDPNDEKSIISNLDKINIKIKFVDGEQRVIMNDIDVTNRLYSLEVSNACSITSAYKFVRDKILDIQRDVAKEHSCIMEGRDITSHVLPNAKYKFYIDASPEIRAKRRMNDEKNTTKELNYDEVLSQIIERDRRDKERTLCPLVLVDDAVYINTDNLTIDEVADKILNIVQK